MYVTEWPTEVWVSTQPTSLGTYEVQLTRKDNGWLISRLVLFVDLPTLGRFADALGEAFLAANGRMVDEAIVQASSAPRGDESAGR